MPLRLLVTACALALGALVPSPTLAVAQAAPPSPVPPVLAPVAAPANPQAKREAPIQATEMRLAPLPRIYRVSPGETGVGDLLTLAGRNFVPGRMRNAVVFARPGIRPVFALADEATEREVKVRIPAKLLPFLELRDGVATPTRFRVSVLSQRLSPSFTALSASPLIGPPGWGQPVPGTQDCNHDGVADTPKLDALGVPVVGLRLAGLPAPGVEVRGLPDVVGLADIEDLPLPLNELPPASAPIPPPAQPVCPPAAPADEQGTDDDNGGKGD